MVIASSLGFDGCMYFSFFIPQTPLCFGLFLFLIELVFSSILEEKSESCLAVVYFSSGIVNYVVFKLIWLN